MSKPQGFRPTSTFSGEQANKNLTDGGFLALIIVQNRRAEDSFNLF